MTVFDKIKEKGKYLHNKHFKHFRNTMPPITKHQIKQAKKKKIEEHTNKVRQAFKVHKENIKSPTYKSVFIQTNQPGIYNIHTDSSCNKSKNHLPLLTAHELAMKNTGHMITQGVASPVKSPIILNTCENDNEKTIETFLNSSFKPINTKQKKINEVLIALLILAIIITFLILIIILYRLIKKKY